MPQLFAQVKRKVDKKREAKGKLLMFEWYDDKGVLIVMRSSTNTARV
jgi:hypothetical protein